MSHDQYEAEMKAAGVQEGAKLVFAFSYDGAGQIGEVGGRGDGMVFLTDGRAIRWAMVLFVKDAE